MKAASEIYSPVSGTVTDKNEEVENGPALINQSPLEDGWMFKWVEIDVKIVKTFYILDNSHQVHTEQSWRCEEFNDFWRVWNLFEGMWRIDEIKFYV